MDTLSSVEYDMKSTQDKVTKVNRLTNLQFALELVSKELNHLAERPLEEEVGAKKICEKETSLISQLFKTLL